MKSIEQVRVSTSNGNIDSIAGAQVTKRNVEVYAFVEAGSRAIAELWQWIVIDENLQIEPIGAPAAVWINIPQESIEQRNAIRVRKRVKSYAVTLDSSRSTLRGAHAGMPAGL